MLAAVWDYRTGNIPNWLTLPVVGATPLLRAGLGGWEEAQASIVGLVVCGLVPVFMFRRGVMGGGDVKLFAALGALLGPFTGLEVQLFGLLAAALFAAARLTYRGQLWRAFRRSWTNSWATLKSAGPGAVEENAEDNQLLEPLRLGPFVLVGLLMATSGQWPWFW
jgi:prepilin peptidase CpaA